MIYTKKKKKALKMCFEQHKNQVDKAGMAYVFHPFHVAEQMNDEDTTIVALLHDVVEDTEITLDDLKSYGFSDEVIEALSLLTHDNKVTYSDYIKKVATNDIARAVKKADLMHNSDLNRLENITEKDIKRVEKYKKSLDYLEYYEKYLKNVKEPQIFDCRK